MARAVKKTGLHLPKRKKTQSGEGRKQHSAAARGLFVFCVLFATIIPIVFVADAISYVPLVTVVLFAAFDVAYLFALSRSLEFGIAAGDEGARDGSDGDIVCERGSVANITVRFRNRSMLVFPRVEVEFFITDLFGNYATRTTHSTTLLPREVRELPIDARFRHLGHYSAGVSQAVIYDLIGFLSKKTERPFERSVTVAPRLLDLNAIPISNASLRESQTATKPIVTDDMDYAGVREYRFGDPMKTVHWKLSSRVPGGELYTRLFEVFGNPGVEIVIDHIAPAYDVENLMHVFDGLMESALSANLYARDQGMDVELAFLDRDNMEISTQIADVDHVGSLVERARKIESTEDSLDPDIAVRLLAREGSSNRGMSNVVFCTSRLTSFIISTLCSIRMRRRHAILFLVVPRSLEGRKRASFLAPVR